MIQINLLRISPDSQYIEFSVECPTNYRFNKLNIKKYDYSTTDVYPTNSLGWVNASNLYVGSSTKEVMRIATSIFGGSTLFYVEFGVQWIAEEDEPLLTDGTKLSDSTTVGICSDINNIYTYLSECLLNIENKCFTLDNDLKRAFILLYGHNESLRLERFEEAEYFYDVLKNNFSNCSTDTRINSTNCNC